ncbi:signal peptidase I [Paenibacillus herberti]|uniref:Signal peptidase I n=1 Tax=Paenibacillus herberti TaxID=1619309 RepID=A0A229P1T9_9BACL|nr:signal peptidase I [Paenibacillus herberti]OXM16068.1 signal peptidase I [Paenibacillus herberti]
MNTEPEQVHPDQGRKKQRLLPKGAETVVMLLMAILLSLLVQQYAFAQTEVHNISMQSTLSEGQRLLENKLAYRFSSPQRGDIAIISGPESELRLVKRIVALPGENVTIDGGKLFINGKPLDEPYATGKTYPLTLRLPFTVPEGHVFVLGDNRENSTDSRELGPVRISSLEGKIIFRLWPMNKLGTVH